MHSTVFTARIARQLAECEQGVDRLLAETATLLAELATARATCDAFGSGQRAISRVVDAQRSITNVQADLLRVHADLLKIGTERGTIVDGDCPPSVGNLTAAA
jgi:outer membrane protein TolC